MVRFSESASQHINLISLKAWIQSIKSCESSENVFILKYRDCAEHFLQEEETDQVSTFKDIMIPSLNQLATICNQ